MDESYGSCENEWEIYSLERSSTHPILSYFVQGNYFAKTKPHQNVKCIFKSLFDIVFRVKKRIIIDLIPDLVALMALANKKGLNYILKLSTSHSV